MSVLASMAPSDWTGQKFGALFGRAQQVGFPELQPLSVFLGDGVVPRSARDDNHNQLGADLSKYQRVQPADFVFNKLRTWQGGFGVSNYEGIVSPAYIVCRPRDAAVEPRFAHHLLRSAPYLAELTRLSKWMPPSQFDISWDEIRTLQLALPPIDEQRRIADFLDDQVARIDNIIAARRAQSDLAVDLWSEQVRTEVSRGSWPQVPLWTVVRWQEGPGILAKDFRDEGIPILRIAHLRAMPPSLVGAQFVDAASGVRTWGHFRTEVGDLMLSGSASVGELAVWVTPEIAGAIPYTGLIKARARDQRLLPEYMRYFFLSRIFGDQIDLLKSGIGIQHWGPSHLSQVKIPLAPLAQQQEVIGNLRLAERDRELQRASLVQSVGLLDELKRSLITAAVTGEFDVSSADGSRVAL